MSGRWGIGLSLVVMIALASCAPWWNVENDYDPSFEIVDGGDYFRGSTGWYWDPGLLGVELNTPGGCCLWTAARVAYVDDGVHDMADYYQSPDQTYMWRAGDCEDFVLLTMYAIRKELGGWPQMILGKYAYDNGEYAGHAWIEYDGNWYEAQTGENITGNPHYQLRESVPYGKAMWRSMNTHQGLLSEMSE